ncbi:3-methyladenine DNA glycosylase [Tersicoccus sp. MR15.9]|uniref:DNA-3-methyladenine glycosylase family protein n=1 Tax=Tersicoccus mangrovi TaxID=3121635 RepID=UPI002FE55958
MALTVPASPTAAAESPRATGTDAVAGVVPRALADRVVLERVITDAAHADGAAAAVFLIPGAYDLRASLGILQHGVQDPSMQLDPGRGAGCWMAFTTASGPASLRLDARTATGANAAGAGEGPTVLVQARAFGPGAADALAAVPALLGAHDDWAGLDDESLSDQLPHFISRTRRARVDVRLPTAGRMLDFAVIAVLGQKITGLEAKRAWQYLVSRFGTPAPGPVPTGLTVPPTGEQWRRVPSWHWHRAGVDNSRSTTILRLAQRASAVERLAALPCGHELVAKLTSIPGIGPWTAAETTQRTHGDPDAVSIGDFHLAKDVGWAFTGAAVDDAGMMQILEPWTGHRQRVVRLMYLSGFRRPRFHPRLAPAEHRFH